MNSTHILQYLSRIFRTDITYLASSASWLAGSTVLLSVLAFVFTVVFANLVAKETFGMYKTMLSIAGFVSAFMLGGLGPALSRAVARGVEGVYMPAFRWSLRWNAVVGLCAALVGIYFLFFLDEKTEGTLLLVVAATTPITEAARLYAYFLQGKSDFKKGSLFGVIHEGTPTVVTLFVLLFSRDVLVLATTFLVTQAIVMFVLFKHVRRTACKPEQNDRETIRYGTQLSIVQTIDLVALQIDRLVLFSVLGPAAVATYTIAIAIPDRLKGLCQVVAKSAFPKFSVRTLTEIRESLPRKLGIMAIVVVLVGVLYVLGAPYVFKLVFPEYVDGVEYSQLATLLLVGSMTPVIGSALSAHKKIRHQAILSSLLPLVKILLVGTLGYTMGITGVIGAQIGYQLLSLLSYNFMLQRA